ncbi:MAG: mechanosensitive ion channel family protein [Desulfobacteraceae bacterium]|jgi:small-conductance mechanosensitive channel
MNFEWLSLENMLNPGTIIGAFLLAVAVIILTWITCIITTRLLRRPNWVTGTLKRKIDETVIHYTIRVKNLLIVIIAFFIYVSCVPDLNNLFNTMLAGAGITALIIGFAAKSTMANLISGLSLAIYRPIRIGDTVTIENEYGTVEDITLRHTIMLTWEHKRLVIPNSKLDEMTLVNYSIIDPRMKCIVELGVSYDTDLDLARRLILEEIERCPYRDKDAEKAVVRVISHGDFSIGLRVYVNVRDAGDMWLARFWLYEHIKKRFDKEGVEIPFPYRTLVYKKDLPPPPREKGTDGNSEKSI